MQQATQRSIADVTRIAALQTVVQVERQARAAEAGRIFTAASALLAEVFAVVERAA